MTAIERLLERIPDIQLDLSHCAEIGSLGLPPPVVVTLERRPDRWDNAVRNLSQSGFARILRAPAVDGSALPMQQLAVILDDPLVLDRPLVQYLQPTRPAVGCFLSHLAIWKRFLRTGAPYLLVVEDDMLPTTAAATGMARHLLADLPPDADMLLLGCTIMDGLAEPTDNARLTRVYYYNGTYAYLITRKGCLALLPRLLPIRTHVDNQISLELVRDRSGLTAYAAEPRLFEHDFTVRSDVYIPVLDAAHADRTLAAIFENARAKLLAEGARLMPKYQPASMALTVA